MANKVATYTYLNSISGSPWNPSNANSLKRCVTYYNFVTIQGAYKVYNDIIFTGDKVGPPDPVPIVTENEFSKKAPVKHYNIKLTLTSTPTGYPAKSYIKTASVWNAKPSAYSSNGAIVSTSLPSFAFPRVSLSGGYAGVGSGQSPTIQSTTPLSSIRGYQVFDVLGTGNATSNKPATGYGPTSVLDKSSTNNVTTYINVTPTASPTVYVAFLYNINNGSTYYVHWVNAIMSLEVTEKYI